MEYRKEIDGLRAVAVLPVILFHAGVSLFQGGFIGVDIFFVISGYLITGIILSDIVEKKFSIINFYERRARRILPALFLVLFFSAIFFPFIMNPDEIKEFGFSIVSVILFVSNIFFWTQSGYFGTVSEITPLLHTWSLAVEEQFYIFFPLLMVLLYPFGKKRLLQTLVFLVLTSLVISEWGWRNAPIANFFLAPPRIWELMMGSMVAVCQREQLFERFSGILRSSLAILGLSAVSASLLLMNKFSPHPGLVTLIPVVGTILIIAFARPENIVGKLLGSRSLSFIGLLSYSLYLWHQPVFAFAKRIAGEDLPVSSLLALIPLIFLTSYLSWRFVERPFRSKTFIYRRGIFLSSAVASVAFFGLGLAFANNLSMQRVVWPDKMLRYDLIHRATSAEFNVMIQKECHFWSQGFDKEFLEKFEYCAKLYDKAIFITGGSHAMDLYNAFTLNAPAPFIVSVSQGYCRAHDFIGRRISVKCHYDDLEKFLSTHASHIEKLVYTQTPDRLFSRPMHKATIADLSVDAVNQVVRYLVGLKDVYGVNVEMMGMFPPITRSPAELDYTRPIEPQLVETVSDRILEQTHEVDRVFFASLDEYGIDYYSKFSLFDLELPRDLLIDGEITYSDSRHLSRAGEEYFGAIMTRKLIEMGYFGSRQLGDR